MARALVERHGHSRIETAAASAAPLVLARRASDLGAALAGAGPELPLLLEEQRRFLVEGVDALLVRAAGGHGGLLHGRLRCANTWVSPRREVHFGLPDPAATGDFAEDVADLAVDLRARGGGRVAEQLLATYARRGDDYALYGVLAFHERSAALRCALDASVRGDRSRPSAVRYLRAARETPRAPVLLAIGGAIASGKSTLAKQLERRLAAPRIVGDAVRRALLAPLPPAIVHELAWAPEFAAHVYAGMLRRAAPVLASGRSVVLDACFARAERRAEAAALAARHGARFTFVHCDPPVAEIEARLRRRERRDGGGWRLLARTTCWEPLRADELEHAVRVETGGPPHARLRAIARRIEAPA